MFPYGPAQTRLNVCYLVGPDKLPDAALTKAYRQWLSFDAFILHDHLPIYYFDENKVGGIEVVPTGMPNSATGPGYKQVDYSNIANLVLMTKPTQEGLPILAYSDMFERYQGLPCDLKEMIEWSVSLPYRSQTRVDAFFKPNYWQLVHAIILLDRLVGPPPECSESFGNCAVCGRLPQPHYFIPRREWLRRFLASRIDSIEVAEEYARVIYEAVLVRNKIAHTPVFDRSSFPDFSPGERQAYDIDRTIEEFKHDSFALQSLLISLSDIARYLLLDKAFGTMYFPRLQPLNTVCVGGSEPSHVKSQLSAV